MLNKLEGINFKKVFAVFFVALGLFAVAAILIGALNGFADSRFLERIMLTRLPERLFTNPLVALRGIGFLFLAAFNTLLALWVYTDGKKRESRSILWPILTLITGLAGWLAYLIKRADHAYKMRGEF